MKKILIYLASAISAFGAANVSVGTAVLNITDSPITLVSQANQTRVFFNASNNWKFSDHLNFNGTLNDYSFNRSDFGELIAKPTYYYSELNSNVDRFNPIASSIIYAEYSGQPFLLETFTWDNNGSTNFRVSDFAAIPEPSYLPLFFTLLWMLGRRR